MVPGSLKSPELFPVKISRHVISFHYVSEMESLLLYHLLSSKFAREEFQGQKNKRTKERRKENGKSIVFSGGSDYGISNGDLKYDLNLTTPRSLLLLWPKTSMDIGHYSRAMKGINESIAILFFLNEHVQINRQNF